LKSGIGVEELPLEVSEKLVEFMKSWIGVEELPLEVVEKPAEFMKSGIGFEELPLEVVEEPVEFMKSRIGFEELPLEVVEEPVEFMESGITAWGITAWGRSRAGWVYEIRNWVWGITAWGRRRADWVAEIMNYCLRNYRLRSQMSRLSVRNQELPVEELPLEVWGSGKLPVWVWEVTSSCLHFPINPKAKHAGWVAVFHGSASASRREATFHSWMQMQIQEWLGLLLDSVFVNGAPLALITKTKSNQSQGWGGDTFECPTFLPHV
jgi:hypothetical protein